MFRTEVRILKSVMEMQAIWWDAGPMPAFETLRGDKKTDVLVIGGGMAGLLCAYFLEQAGADYLLIEADRICRGVTGSTTAKITAQHGRVYHRLIRQFGAERARMYWEANEAALGEYRRLSRKFPCGFEEKDAFLYATDKTGRLEREWRALQKLGIGAEYWGTLPLPLTVTGAIRLPGQAQFHPLRFAGGLAQGLKIYERTAARAFDGRAVLTDHGKITASQIVVATHFPIFNKHGAYFLKLYQQRSYVLALENAADVGGIYVDEKEDGLSFRNAGELLLLGGGSHRTGKPGGSWEALRAFAQTRYPDARERCCWATQDCMTLDGVPYIGLYAKTTPRLYVAAGFNKWGMSSSMTAALLLRDLLAGRENPWTPLFSPSRSVLRPQLFRNAAEAAVSLLTPTRPRCPHMGCALRWNAREHSWDCPCHGSRFSETGELLEAPATDDLP